MSTPLEYLRLVVDVFTDQKNILSNINRSLSEIDNRLASLNAKIEAGATDQVQLKQLQDQLEASRSQLQTLINTVRSTR
jgi:uncharacterized protein involved in exopolysaccharide biosynthesis